MFCEGELSLEKRSCDIERWISDYSQYLLTERGVVHATVKNYLPYARMFLNESCENLADDLFSISGQDVIAFVRNHQYDQSPKRLKLMITALRSFLRFLRFVDAVSSDLDTCVPIFANWKSTNIPVYLSSSEVKKLLACCDKKTATGRRDFAILLFITRLGLRACEVTSLALDDINWREGEITIYGKGKKTKCPLPKDVGQALANYLKRRQKSQVRKVFLCSKGALRGFSNSSSLDRVISGALKRANLHPPKRGAHLLRYTAANQLLINGASLHDVAELLRHSSINTTAIYAKIDFLKLENVVQPWPIASNDQGITP